jgi:hypothetical protein
MHKEMIVQSFALVPIYYVPLFEKEIMELDILIKK